MKELKPEHVRLLKQAYDEGHVPADENGVEMQDLVEAGMMKAVEGPVKRDMKGRVYYDWRDMWAGFRLTQKGLEFLQEVRGAEIVAGLIDDFKKASQGAILALRKLPVAVHEAALQSAIARARSVPVRTGLRPPTMTVIKALTGVHYRELARFLFGDAADLHREGL